MLESQKSVTLKLSEPAIDSANPWSDDLLARQNIATRLTNLVATQEPPLVYKPPRAMGNWQDLSAQALAKNS